MANSYGFELFDKDFYYGDNDTMVKIINRHKNDFNSKNYSSKIKAAGGFTAYVKSLGGVFTEEYSKVASPSNKATTIMQLRKRIAYVSGLMAIWGFDYYNGKTYWHWGSTTSKPASDAFYLSGKGKCNGGYIHQLCMGSSGKARTTCCNYGVDTVFRACHLYIMGCDHMKGMVTQKKATVIRKKANLKPGDMVHFFSNKITSDNPATWGAKKWHHVAIVYAVTKDQVILADYGSRFIKTKKPFHCMSRKVAESEPGGSYSNYHGWAAERFKSYKFATDKSPTTNIPETTTTETTTATDTTTVETPTVPVNESSLATSETPVSTTTSTVVQQPAAPAKKEIWQTPMPKLYKGKKGRAVKIWQIIIGAKVDGDFGAKTVAATKTFQKNHGLYQDGIVDVEEWQAGLKKFIK